MKLLIVMKFVTMSLAECK